MSEDDQMYDLPIACSLSSGDLETRQAELAALGRRSLVSVDRPDGAPVVLSFKRDPATTAELERIVAAEAECCAFLRLTILENDLLQLEVEGPRGAGAVIDELVTAFAAEAAA